MNSSSAERQLTGDAYRLRDAGWVVLHDAVPADLIQTVAEAAQGAISELLAEIGGIDALAHEAVGPGRVGAYLSLTPPFADPLVLANPAVLPLVRAALGPQCELSLFGLDCSFPGAPQQVVHRDFAGLPRPAGIAPAATERLVVNLPLCPFDDETGPTELWPTTHLIPDDDPPPPGEPPPPSLDERAAALTPVRLYCRPGDVVIRNPRAWHRGSANGSFRRRAMIAVGYSAPWVRYPPLHVPDATWTALAPADQALLDTSRRHGRPLLATAQGSEPVLQLEPHWADTSDPARRSGPI